MNADESPTDIPLRAVMATCTRVAVAVVIKGKVSSTHDFQIEILHQNASKWYCTICNILTHIRTAKKVT